MDDKVKSKEEIIKELETFDEYEDDIITWLEYTLDFARYFEANPKPVKEYYYYDNDYEYDYYGNDAYINFSNIPLFITDMYDEFDFGEYENEDTWYEYEFEKGSSLFLNESYGGKINQALLDTADVRCLWKGYKEKYNESEFELFISFVKKCGIISELTIVDSPVAHNPLYWKELDYTKERHTHNETGYDYNIPELTRFLGKSTEVSYLIWTVLETHKHKYNNFDWKSHDKHDYLHAEYSPNQQARTRECDSSLMYYLKNYEWVPDKNGKLHKPSDICIEDIRSDFIYDEENPLMTALDFNSRKAENEKRLKKLVYIKKEAKSFGMTLVKNDKLEQLEADSEKLKRILDIIQNT